MKVFSSFGAFQLNIGLQFMESGSLERLLSASVELHFTKKRNKNSHSEGSLLQKMKTRKSAIYGYWLTLKAFVSYQGK